MKRIILLLILTFSLQTLSKADNISDFEIEGISIGDSLLEHFSKRQIDNNEIKKSFKDQSIQGILFQDIDFIINYDAMQFVYKLSNMEIINITALTRIGEDINECKVKMDKVILDLSNIFSNTERDKAERNHPADTTGKSKVISSYFYFENTDFVAVECEQWSKHMGHPNVLKVSLRTRIYNDILRKEYNEE